MFCWATERIPLTIPLTIPLQCDCICRLSQLADIADKHICPSSNCGQLILKTLPVRRPFLLKNREILKTFPNLCRNRERHPRHLYEQEKVWVRSPADLWIHTSVSCSSPTSLTPHSRHLLILCLCRRCELRFRIKNHINQAQQMFSLAIILQMYILHCSGTF